VFGFLLDFQGKPTDPNITNALERVTAMTFEFKNLGFYRGASI